MGCALPKAPAVGTHRTEWVPARLGGGAMDGSGIPAGPPGAHWQGMVWQPQATLCGLPRTGQLPIAPHTLHHPGPMSSSSCDGGSTIIG